MKSKIVLGAFGKRSTIDQKMQRKFIKQKSPWLAVKGHYKGNFPNDVVGLHNFKGGYCGVSKVENDLVNICYLGNVAELLAVKETAAAWMIGAAVPLEQVMHLVSDAYADFAEVLRRFGSPPIRSTATLAGNIANGSPIGDTMPCLMALEATLHLRKGEKKRTVALDKFYTGMKASVLQAGEFITAIELPKPKTGSTFKATKSANDSIKTFLRPVPQ